MFSKDLINQSCIVTNGCFDVLHVGHFKLFKYIADYERVNDAIAVCLLNSDASMRLNGKDPVFNQNQRLKQIKALDIFDYIIVFDELTPIKVFKQLDIERIVKGKEYANKSIEEKSIYADKIVYIDCDYDISSTKLKQSIYNKYKNR